MPTWGVLVLALGIALNVGMVLATFSSGLHPDFVGLHTAARDFDEGRPLYHTSVDGTRNLNPPHVAVAMWPLASLPARQAIVVWWVFCGLCAGWCIFRWRQVFPPPFPLLMLGVILVTPAGYAAVLFGSWTWPLTAVFTEAWLAYRRGDTARAGMILGFLASWRVFALLFAPYLVWKRQWKALASLCGAFASVWAVGLAVCGIQEYLDWATVLREIDLYGDFYNVSFLGVSRRLLGDALGYTGLVRPVWLLLNVGVLLITWLRVRREDDGDLEWACLALLCLLLSPLGWAYYLALGAGPIGAVLLRRRPQAVWAALPFFMVPWSLARQLVTPVTYVPVLSLPFVGTVVLLALCLRRGLGEPTGSEVRRAERLDKRKEPRNADFTASNLADSV